MIAQDAAVVGEQLLAHHPLIVAVPVFVPAIAVVAAVLYIARKDRLEEAAERELIERGLEQDDTSENDREDET